MSDEKVVPLFSAVEEGPVQPNEGLVEVIEDFLELAKEGKSRYAVLIYDEEGPDGPCTRRYVTEMPFSRLAMSYMVMDMVKEEILSHAIDPE